MIPPSQDSLAADLEPSTSPYVTVRSWLARGRTGRAFAGLVVDFLGSSSSIVIALLFTPMVVAWLGAPMYGFWIAASQIILWLSLLDGGIGANLMKTISTHRASAPERVERAIASTFWCYVCIAVATLLIGASMTPFVSRWMHLHGEAARQGTITFAVAVFTSVVALVAVPTFYVILNGFQKLALVNGLVSGVSIAGTIGGLLFVWAGLGVIGLAVAQLLATLAGAVLALLWSRRLFPFRLSLRYVSRSELVEMLRFALYFTMSKTAFLTSNYSDGILIAMFYGTAPVAVFALTQKLSSAAFMFVVKVGSVAVPGLAELMGAGDRPALRSVITRMTRILVRIAILAATIILTLNHRFVAAWTGEATFGGALLTALFAWGIFRDTIIRNLSAPLFASGDLKGWGLLSSAEAVLKVGLSIALLPILGIVGPMVGTAVAELITGVYTPFKLIRLLDIDPRTIFSDAILPPFLRSLPTVAVMTFLAFVVPAHWRWFGIVTIASAGVLANIIAFDLSHIATFFRQPQFGRTA
ncbi:MAG TPA: oligosaccharide flippase family protein [Thermoanaerobaculia bacterium]|nr:oligosaccharide flippase family protein [Thermoanaerobaculia bacterium]